MKIEEFSILLENMGFAQILKGQVDGTQDEWFVSWKDGLLVFHDSYQGSVNRGDVYFNYVFKEGEEEAGLPGFSGSSIEIPGGTFVKCGSFNVREGFRHKLKLCEEKGVFLTKWIKQPFLWLLHYKDTKIPGYSYEEINRGRISLLPLEVQEAIEGTITD